MKSSRNAGTTTSSRFFSRALIAAAAGFLLPFCVAFAAAPADAKTAAASLSEDDKKCLDCHSSEGLKKRLTNGDLLSLHVRGGEFEKSVHIEIGCGGCHSDVDLDKHPGARKNIASAREYAIAMGQVCRTCHKAKFKQYEGSIHAALVREGNKAAPVCSDCHGSHTIGPKAAYETIAGVPCKNCHEAIFDAYVGSMHGQARGKLGHVQAPICSDCHRAHEVSAVSLGNRLRDACLACHKNAAGAHDKWLPNSRRHLEVVSCPSCHAPTAQRRVELRLSVDKDALARMAKRARSIDAQGNDLDPVALWNLLREFNREGTAEKPTLRGRMVARTGVEAHQLAAKTKAVRDCDSCHRQGADPFQTVTVSIAGPDGKPVRIGAEKEVLNSVISVDSVGGFYAIGGTRIKLLDILLALAVLGGISVPIGHLMAKRILGKRLKKENAAENPQVQIRDLPGDRSDGSDVPEQQEK